MKEALRARAGWTLAGVASVLALVDVAQFAATGTFSAAWLTVSLVAYGIIVLAAIALAIFDPGAPPVAMPLGAPDGARLVDRVVTYRTATGMVVRMDYLWPDGSLERRQVVFTDGETLTLHEVEAHLDAFPPAPPSAVDDETIDAEIERWRAKPNVNAPIPRQEA